MTPDEKARSLTRFVFKWAENNGYHQGGLPFFDLANNELGVYLFQANMPLDRAPIPYRKFGDVEAETRAIAEWAESKGYIGSMPSFFFRDDKVWAYLFKSSAPIEKVYVPYPELEAACPDVTNRTVEAKARAVAKWAVSKGYLGGVPYFRCEDNKLGAYLFKSGAPMDTVYIHSPKVNKSKRSKNKRLKKRLWEEVHNCALTVRVKCHYCPLMLTFEEATVDHVTPKSQGGADNLSNVVICCYWDNQDLNTWDQMGIR